LVRLALRLDAAQLGQYAATHIAQVSGPFGQQRVVQRFLLAGR